MVSTASAGRWRNWVGQRWAVRARFVLVATACLLPLFGVVLYVLYQANDAGRDQLFDDQNAAAEVVAKVLEATLAENEKVLTDLASTDRIRRLEPTQADDLL